MTSSIIIIDDCELIKVSLLKILPDYSGSIQYYNNLLDVLKELKKVNELKKHIFIPDLELVTCNGVRELTRTMPQNYYDIILLTSMPLSHTEKEVDGIKIAKIFTKPFNFRELSETIVNLDKTG